MGSKPVVFLSSTIYDFRDLRGALKFYFESKGYEVLASESNDFYSSANQHSYDICLEAIRDRATHFVLLIGSRAGGRYPTGTTITQQEYREAYAKAQKGELSILTFVRKEVWDVREDRKGLEELIETDEIVRDELRIGAESHGDTLDNLAEKLRTHDSRIIRNASLIFNFIEEVAKASETRSAVNNATPFGLPQSNWIYTFYSFQDIVQTLEVVFKTDTPIELDLP